jgi:hypothetical protein
MTLQTTFLSATFLVPLFFPLCLYAPSRRTRPPQRKSPLLPPFPSSPRIWGSNRCLWTSS